MSVAWLVAAILATMLLTMWVTFTLTRLDRLHARVDAAQAALDAQLVRRVAAVRHAAESGESPLTADERVRYERVAQAALIAQGGDRQICENEVGRVAGELVARGVPGPAEAELHEASVRVLIAKRFYNDAVRDTRSLRARRLPRVLHLAGHRELPQFFDIDETLPAASPVAASEDRSEAFADDQIAQEGQA